MNTRFEITKTALSDNVALVWNYSWPTWREKTTFSIIPPGVNRCCSISVSTFGNTAADGTSTNNFTQYLSTPSVVSKEPSMHDGKNNTRPLCHIFFIISHMQLIKTYNHLLFREVNRRSQIRSGSFRRDVKTNFQNVPLQHETDRTNSFTNAIMTFVQQQIPKKNCVYRTKRI